MSTTGTPHRPRPGAVVLRVLAADWGERLHRGELDTAKAMLETLARP